MFNAASALLTNHDKASKSLRTAGMLPYPVVHHVEVRKVEN